LAICLSTGFSDAAWTCTMTSPSLGTGSGNSSHRGAFPSSCTTAARIRVLTRPAACGSAARWGYAAAAGLGAPTRHARNLGVLLGVRAEPENVAVRVSDLHF